MVPKCQTIQIGTILFFYRGLAKVVEKYVHKGDRLYVEGRIRYRSYDDKQGRRQYITEIYVDNMEMFSTRPATKRTIIINF